MSSTSLVISEAAGRPLPGAPVTRPGGYPAPGRLEANRAGPRGRDPDGTTAVTGPGDRDHLAGDGRPGPPGGAAGVVSQVPGVVGVTVHFRIGDIFKPKLRVVGLTEYDEAGVGQCPGKVATRLRHLTLEQAVPVGSGQALKGLTKPLYKRGTPKKGWPRSIS